MRNYPTNNENHSQQNKYQPGYDNNQQYLGNNQQRYAYTPNGYQPTYETNKQRNIYPPNNAQDYGNNQLINRISSTSNPKRGSNQISLENDQPTLRSTPIRGYSKPTLDNNQPTLDNNQPIPENNRRILRNKRPEPVTNQPSFVNDPLTPSFRPILLEDEPTLVNKKPTFKNYQPMLVNQPSSSKTQPNPSKNQPPQSPRDKSSLKTMSSLIDMLDEDSEVSPRTASHGNDHGHDQGHGHGERHSFFDDDYESLSREEKEEIRDEDIGKLFLITTTPAIVCDP